MHRSRAQPWRQARSSPLEPTGLLFPDSSRAGPETKDHRPVKMTAVTTTGFLRPPNRAEQKEQRRATILATARRDARPPATRRGQPPGTQPAGRAFEVECRASTLPTPRGEDHAVLTEDWDAGPSAVEAALPAVDTHRLPRATQELTATAIAQTLGGHQRFCGLLAVCQAVLEHNVPPETAHEFKTAALARLNRLADLVRLRLPRLGDAESFEFAGIVWVLVAGAWPMAHPSPVVATVLAEPQFTPMRIEFTDALTRERSPSCSSGLTRVAPTPAGEELLRTVRGESNALSWRTAGADRRALTQPQLAVLTTSASP